LLFFFFFFFYRRGNALRIPRPLRGEEARVMWDSLLTPGPTLPRTGIPTKTPAVAIFVLTWGVVGN
jgi:hypothetical protein